jgi:repressor LexA
MAEAPELTDRQKQVLEFIEDRIREWGYPPTIREIGEHFGIKSTNGVVDHLKALKRKGFLRQQDMKSRTLTPVVPKRGKLALAKRADTAVPILVPKNNVGVAIPLLGKVAAGQPILAEENAEGSVVIDSVLVGDGKKLFALKVVGESMIDDGIHDGDYIFVRKRNHADPGDIVVVIIDNDATVKRFYPEGDRVRLQPANATMQPIYVSKRDFKDVQILGIVVGVYRKM